MSERFTATYRLTSRGPLEKAAQLLAGEQSAGTFVRVAFESDQLLQEHGAVVESIVREDLITDSLPGTRPLEGEVLESGVVEISFPTQNLGPSIPALLSTVAGNFYELRDLAGAKLLDVEIPAALLGRYKGATHGTSGTREVLGAPEGVLVGTIIKPSVGLRLEQLGTLVSGLAEARIDFIKDDELMTDPPYAPRDRRIAKVLQELDRAAQKTGKRTMYAINITDELDEMKRAVDEIAAHGGTCAMVTVPAVGFPALSELRRYTDLVIHGHKAGFGALDRPLSSGYTFRVFQKLAQLSGADHLHVSGISSKFWESDEMVASNVRALQHSPALGQNMLPVLSSAQTPATAELSYRMLQTDDLLVLAGGGIHAHPGGIADGVSSMRDAWRAVTSGNSPHDASVPGSPLDIALRIFS